MTKYLFYGMTGEKMCFQHILLNALDLANAGEQVRIVFEGASVKLVATFEADNHPLYRRAKAAGIIAGVCKACSMALGVYDANLASGLTMLEEMSGHAGMKPFLAEGYTVISM
ncbi:MAG: hypothetical protein GXY52_06165 [Chloroflexi bacterium]|nr:hypothetical protein [Chloroflexota bacterium]